MSAKATRTRHLAFFKANNYFEKVQLKNAMRIRKVVLLKIVVQAGLGASKVGYSCGSAYAGATHEHDLLGCFRILSETFQVETCKLLQLFFRFAEDVQIVENLSHLR